MRKLLTLPLLWGALAAPLATLQAAEPSAALNAVIESRSDEQRARDAYRHPAETLTFFQVEPGMTVAEALPGRGWYTTILADYLGGDGALYGINYPDRLWSLFSWATEDIVAERIAATGKFPGMVRELSNSGVDAKDDIEDYWTRQEYGFDALTGDDGASAGAVGVLAYPTNVVVDPDGKVLWASVGWDEHAVKYHLGL